VRDWIKGAPLRVTRSRIDARRRSASSTRRRGTEIVTCVIAAGAIATSCGDDDSNTNQIDPSTPVPTTSAPSPTEPTSVVETTATTARPTTTSAQAGLEQFAIWPAADVVFESPEAAATDFIVEVLGVPASLGEFQQGDMRSGEIEVFSARDGDAGIAVVRGLLLLRQLGPHHGWFVLAAINDHTRIDAPASGAQIDAGPLTVEGVARGFEANVVVTALVADKVGTELDRQITMGGAFDTAEPFNVTLDLSAAPPGETVMLLIRGGAGLEDDPGDFAAIPVGVTG
jgi:hypothetical protein